MKEIANIVSDMITKEPQLITKELIKGLMALCGCGGELWHIRINILYWV